MLRYTSAPATEKQEDVQSLYGNKTPWAYLTLRGRLGKKEFKQRRRVGLFITTET